MSIYPKDSRSSFLDNSIPLCAAMLAYLEVPRNGLLSFNGLIIRFTFNTYVYYLYL